MQESPLILITPELGGKSPNIFFAEGTITWIEGLAMFASSVPVPAAPQSAHGGRRQADSGPSSQGDRLKSGIMAMSSSSGYILSVGRAVGRDEGGKRGELPGYSGRGFVQLDHLKDYDEGLHLYLGGLVTITSDEEATSTTTSTTRPGAATANRLRRPGV